MLEHLPGWLGEALSNVRAGADKVVAIDLASADTTPITLTSTAFAEGARLPERFTADGEGVSPPLTWTDPPEGTQALALIVEDPDAPAPDPLVHAILWDIDPATNALPEGAVGVEGDGEPGGARPETGRNSYLQTGWLPPDPPTGHGAHRYVFQLFALSQVPDLDGTIGRGELKDKIGPLVIGLGVLTGTYSRGEAAPSGPAGAPATA